MSYTPRYPSPLPTPPVTDPPFVAPGDWDKDFNTENNSSTASTTVQAMSDLSITKSGPPTVALGGNLTYTINFSNAGPSNAAGVMIVDTLPKGLTVVGNPPPRSRHDIRHHHDQRRHDGQGQHWDPRRG
ncbi:MAG: DUF11 domain-containing protein [Acidobacteria bacterium]|nr:DUF11 domain-containing protein [Acidobacteriota bacterium]